MIDKQRPREGDEFAQVTQGLVFLSGHAWSLPSPCTALLPLSGQNSGTLKGMGSSTLKKNNQTIRGSVANLPPEPGEKAALRWSYGAPRGDAGNWLCPWAQGLGVSHTPLSLSSGGALPCPPGQAGSAPRPLHTDSGRAAVACSRFRPGLLLRPTWLPLCPTDINTSLIPIPSLSPVSSLQNWESQATNL